MREEIEKFLEKKFEEIYFNNGAFRYLECNEREYFIPVSVMTTACLKKIEMYDFHILNGSNFFEQGALLLNRETGDVLIAIENSIGKEKVNLIISTPQLSDVKKEFRELLSFEKNLQRKLNYNNLAYGSNSMIKGYTGVLDIKEIVLLLNLEKRNHGRRTIPSFNGGYKNLFLLEFLVSLDNQNQNVPEIVFEKMNLEFLNPMLNISYGIIDVRANEDGDLYNIIDNYINYKIIRFLSECILEIKDFDLKNIFTVAKKEFCKSILENTRVLNQYLSVCKTRFHYIEFKEIESTFEKVLRNYV